MRFPNPAELLPHWFFILPFAGDWNYENPSTWPLTYPQCGRVHQSPIALRSRHTFPNELLELKFTNYQKPLAPPVRIINNGYSAEVGIRINEDRSFPTVSVGDFNDQFEVAAVHFHWGSDGIPGSEHSIDGERYDLEMHIVHKNSKYSTVEEAREFKDGFIVLAVLFEGVPFQEDENHRTLKEIYNSLNSISKYNSTTELTGSITMESFLPGVDVNEFFAYKGSLTTPPCSESVMWFVFPDILPIAFDDLSKFWTLIDKKGRPLVNNFRPLQIGTRPVFRVNSYGDSNY